jgi:phosphoribosylformylglycinamidine synthase
MTGAQPLAITDCLNFGSPEDPGVMWQFVEAIKGLVDGCAQLGVPVTGGNVSFYNQTDGRNILPTPMVGMLGLLDDVTARIPMGFHHPGDAIYLLGITRQELAGSAWEDVVHGGHLGGLPPFPRLDAEKNLATLTQRAAGSGLLRSAHDLSEGGLAMALVESCLRSGLGARVRPEIRNDPSLDATIALFSESPARAVVSLDPQRAGELETLSAELGVACAPLGEVTTEPRLVVEEILDIGLDELREAWARPIPAAMD